MPSLLSTCEELFKTNDLYRVLNTEKTASDKEIKKAYHKASLKVHPDRVDEAEKEEATRKFQAVSAVYAVLSDADKKGTYDETGEVDDENDPLTQDRDWEDYWRLLFPKVTLKDIQNFENEYRGSEEERSDIKQAYLDTEGDMDAIMDRVMCSRQEDEDRFREIVQGMIDEKEVSDLPKFSHEAPGRKKARKKAAKKEAEEAAEAAAEMGLNDENSLESLILKRQANRGRDMDNFLDGLAEKYGKPKKGKKK